MARNRRQWGFVNRVLDERERQNRKWGEQNHPSFDQVLLNRKGSCTPQRMAEHYEIPTPTRARFLCETAFNKGEGTWMHILQEEVSELLEADSHEKLKEELVQIAAVAMAWAECIDRNEDGHPVRQTVYCTKRSE